MITCRVLSFSGLSFFTKTDKITGFFTRITELTSGRGGIWYTRMLEVHMPQGLEVQVLSSAPILGD